MTPAPDEIDDTADAGFTLAEVLVAFAILALVTLAMMRAFSGTSLALSHASVREDRLDLAARIVEEQRAREVAEPGRREGVEDGLGWWTVLEPTEGAGLPAPEGTPRLFRLTVGVAPKGAKPGAPLLTTLILARGTDGR